jgi:fructose-1-phosphate kinase PfkB-like protein
MLHYKVFTSAAYGDDMAELEKAVNTWLEEAQPLVHTMTQSNAGASVVISFLYELDEDEEQRATVATAEAIVEQSAQRFDLTMSDSVTITLLPHAELPY